MDSQKKKPEPIIQDAHEIIEKRVCRTCGLTLSSRIFICPNDGTVLADSSKLGEELAVQYEIIEELGSGAAGAIYKARHLALDRLVAIKLLHTNRLNEVSMRRFAQEAKLVSLLEHPSIVRVLHSGVTETGQPYTVLDFIDGQTLAQALEWHGVLPLSDFFDIFIQLCNALEHAHKKGVLHRDVKPSNIMLIREQSEEVSKSRADDTLKETPRRSEQRAKLLDFGIAKVMDDGADQLTRTGEIFGSPLYMSPEQASGKALDQRSDIYALGVVMYETLAGSPPFQANSAIEVITAHINDTARPIKSLNESIPENVVAIVDKALSKNPDDRFQSMSQLRDALKTVRDGREEFVTLVDVSKAERKRKERTITILSVLALLAALLLIGWFEWSALDTPIVPIASKTSVADSPMPLGDKSGETALQKLARHYNDKEIDILDINAEITDESLEIFDKASNTQSVSLRLATHLQGSGLAHLIHLPLTTLSLSSSNVTNRAIEEITHMTHLQDLNLTGTNIDDEGIKQLLVLKNLKILKLRDEEKITNEGLSNLKKLKNLSSLHLSKNSWLSVDGLAALTALPALSELYLDFTNVDDSFCSLFKQFKGLKYLALRRTKVSDEGVAQLLDMHLQSLDLGDSKITDKSLKMLANLRSLKELGVHGTKVTASGMQELAAKRPDLKVHFAKEASFNKVTY